IWLPGVEMVRNYSRALVVFSLGGSLWLGLAATFAAGKFQAKSSNDRVFRLMKKLGYMLSTLTAIVLLGYLLLPQILPLVKPLFSRLFGLFVTMDKPFDWYWQNSVLGFLSRYIGNWLGWLAIAAASAWLMLRYFKKPTCMGTILLMVILGIDLLWPTMRYLQYSSPGEVLPVTEGIRYLQSDTGLYRIATRNMDVGYGQRAVFPGASVTAFGIQTVGGRGDYSDYYRRYLEYIQRSSGTERPFPHQDYLTVYDSKLLDMLNTKYIVTYPGDRDITGSKFELVFDGDLRIYLNHGALPRAWIVHRAEIVPDIEQTLDLIFRGSFDPRQTVILSGDSPIEPVNIASTGEGMDGVDIERYTANEVVLKTTSTQEGYLVLADQYFPGWKAEVDGIQVKIARANYVSRAVHLPPGAHRVVFRYIPDSYLKGLVISMFSLSFAVLITLAGLFIGRRIIQPPPGGR
ncbi:MAG: YfhO family protein, partial [Dehalococcoidia bacterium]|nr:YfhO family protein [Dehalococcoidia bacterium]